VPQVQNACSTAVRNEVQPKASGQLTAGLPIASGQLTMPFAALGSQPGRSRTSARNRLACWIWFGAAACPCASAPAASSTVAASSDRAIVRWVMPSSR
jgi:hypothetical protein